MFSNIAHDSNRYTASSSIAVNSAGIIFTAVVILGDDQYMAINRINPANKENREIFRIYAKDQRLFNISEGADPAKMNGKYGNVSIDILGEDIYLLLEIRYDDVNKQRWAILKGMAK